MPFLLDTERIAELAVAVLARDVVLPSTTLRVGRGDYVGTGGVTTIRVPQRRTAQLRSGSIDFTPIDETPVTVDLSYWYDAATLTDEMLTLELSEFSRQVLAPMLSGVAEASEQVLADVMNEIVPAFGFQDLTDPAKTEEDVLAAREYLSSHDAPTGDRYLAVSPSVATSMLKLDKFSRVDASGSDTALRDATLGRIYGMTVVESNALSADSAVAYHRTGFVFATLAPVVPAGAPYAVVSIEKGIALRTIAAFNVADLADSIAISTFAGAASIEEDNRVIRIAEDVS